MGMKAELWLCCNLAEDELEGAVDTQERSVSEASAWLGRLGARLHASEVAARHLQLEAAARAASRSGVSTAEAVSAVIGAPAYVFGSAAGAAAGAGAWHARAVATWLPATSHLKLPAAGAAQEATGEDRSPRPVDVREQVRALTRAPGPPTLSDVLRNVTHLGVHNTELALVLPVTGSLLAGVEHVVVALAAGSLAADSDADVGQGADAVAAASKAELGRLDAREARWAAWRRRVEDEASLGKARPQTLWSIVELLSEVLALTPSVVAERIGMSRQHASKQLIALSQLGIVHEVTGNPRRRIYLADDLEVPSWGGSLAARREARRRGRLAVAAAAHPPPISPVAARPISDLDRHEEPIARARAAIDALNARAKDNP